MLIDRYLPTFDVTQISETRVEASPNETYRATHFSITSFRRTT